MVNCCRSDDLVQVDQRFLADPGKLVERSVLLRRLKEQSLYCDLV